MVFPSTNVFALLAISSSQKQLISRIKLAGNRRQSATLVNLALTIVNQSAAKFEIESCGVERARCATKRKRLVGFSILRVGNMSRANEQVATVTHGP